jgi:hypothetical protein
MPVKTGHVDRASGHETGKITDGVIPTLVKIDPHIPGNQQANIHTRWHPDIPWVAGLNVTVADSLDA